MSHAKVPLVETIHNDHDTQARDAVLAAWGDRPAVVFGSWRQPRPSRTSNRLIWHKAKTSPGVTSAAFYSAEEEVYLLGRGWCGTPTANGLVTNEQRSNPHGLVARTGHPTPKPVGLMERLIQKCPPGVIADPFAGSGATLLAARAQGRRSIGVELEERYCELIASRLAQGDLFGGAA
jgi:site-specific DNA-methyltransferase (adenine-specific)